MEDLYELHTLISEQNLQIFQLTNKINTLEHENKQLKQNIELLAMENSHQQLNSKRKISQEVINRWKHYHDHKKEIALQYQLHDWRIIKAKCDDLFASNR